ncbi:Cell division control protein 6 [Galdieria sulphuraria]|nr:Cell division control protein 6 [Galdieria sulphuraria]
MIAADNNNNGLQDIHPIYINCATISDPKTIYSVITSQLEESVRLYSSDTKTNWIRAIENIQAKQHILLILEELDFLVTRDMSVLCSLLESPYSLSKVGILATANSVDLPERAASCLKLYSAQPVTMPLSPYGYEEIESILYQRLCLAKASYPCLEKIPVSHFTDAFQLVAKKIATSCGDIRLALDVIRTLLLSAAKRIPAEYHGEDSFLLQDAAKILEEKGGLTSMKNRIGNLPFQQQLAVLACLLLSQRKSLFTLNELYSQLTQLNGQLELPCISFSQFVDICETSLSDHGIIQLEGRKIDKRRVRCSLLTCANEVKAALEPFTVYASWL